MSIGSASVMSPFNTSPTKNNGSRTSETTILETPQAALIANINSFPNTINIKIVKTNDNIFSLPPSVWFYVHYTEIYSHNKPFLRKNSIPYYAK